MMAMEQHKVREFHEAMGHPAADSPTLIPEDRVILRHALIEEELSEYVVAALDGDMPGIADALADMLYVVYGTAVEHGIRIAPIFAAVHNANMSKLDENGEPVPHPYVPGKIGKSDRFREPTADIEAELEAQGW